MIILYLISFTPYFIQPNISFIQQIKNKKHNPQFYQQVSLYRIYLRTRMFM